MQVPLELSFHGVPRSDWSENDIRERAANLERFCDNIMACRVVVEAPHKGHQNRYRVRIEVTIPPNHDLVADKEMTEVGTTELSTVIRNTFDVMERQIKETVERRRHDVKSHAGEPRALVVRLFPEQDYGFIRDPKGTEEYYFHRNAVLHDDFDRLRVGTEVRFEATMGEMGPQASSIQIVDKPGARESGEPPPELPMDWQ